MLNGDRVLKGRPQVANTGDAGQQPPPPPKADGGKATSLLNLEGEKRIPFVVSQLKELLSGDNIGFDKIVAKGGFQFSSDFFHYLPRRHFECNYGNTLFPNDRWFGPVYDGNLEAHARMVQKMSARRSTNRISTEG